jgi:hypothetical protein
MATAPKPKPKPEPPAPAPDPDDEEAARGEPWKPGDNLDPPQTNASGITLTERVENLENRMTAVEERQKAPPVGLGRRP